MVAHAVRTNAHTRGARPFDPTRDLTGVARLLEEAFRSEHTFPLANTPVLRELGIVLWTMSYTPVFPQNVTGYVWIEDGQIVGNVTISQDEGRLDRFMISNVATKPNYQRQGIARALMEMTLESLRGRGARWVLLNVRPQNTGAVKLYLDLGFREVEMRGEWTASPLIIQPTAEAPHITTLRRMRSIDRHYVHELLRDVTPPSVLQFRSPRLVEYGPNWEGQLTESIADFLVGQVTERWVVTEGRNVRAMLVLRGQRLATPHRIMIQVHPDWRGQIENDLVAFALQRVARLPKREIRADGVSTHPELIAALEAHGFRFLNGLQLMAQEFPDSAPRY